MKKCEICQNSIENPKRRKFCGRTCAKEGQKAVALNYRLRHGDNYKEMNRQHNARWEAMNPEKAMIKSAKSRAKEKGIDFSLSHEDVHIPECCPILGIKLVSGRGTKGHGGPSSNSPSLDRIVPKLGYVPGNVVVVSYRANRLKSDASIEELQALAEFYCCLRQG